MKRIYIFRPTITIYLTFRLSTALGEETLVKIYKVSNLRTEGVSGGIGRDCWAERAAAHCV